jgi:hypothetical protein
MKKKKKKKKNNENNQKQKPKRDRCREAPLPALGSAATDDLLYSKNPLEDPRTTEEPLTRPRRQAVTHTRRSTE